MDLSGPAGEPTTTEQAKPVEFRPGEQIGGYKILRRLGEGGSGMVYMAEQEEPIHRYVALKVIKLGMDTRSVIARFDAERQALALMDHPNIAKVLDAGATESGRPYFIMELVEGIKITEFCDQNPLSLRDRLELFVQVCRAVQHAHQKGIIHRDLKPSNILVTIKDGAAVPKIIDFGIAKATQGRLADQTFFTAFDQFIGTPAYMSPEQAVLTSQDVDTRSDIYSLGVLLYELLTGSTPFDTQELLRSGVDEMRRIIRKREPERPSTRLLLQARARGSNAAPSALRIPHTAFTQDLDWIVMKCLEKDRARRYETANGLGADVQRHLNQEPVVARPPSNLYRFQKLIRRNKLAAAAATSVFVCLILGIAATIWQAVRAERLRGQAEANSREARHLVYVADMNMAQQAWEQNNVGLVHDLLMETAALPDRGFEWFYWQRQTHRELKTLWGHTGAVTCVAYSPDGQRVATSSEDGTAKVWDPITGKLLLTFKEHGAGVTSVAFSPDGQRIATGSLDGTTKLWQAAGGKALVTLDKLGAGVRAVAFSPDGQRLVTASNDHRAGVWDAASGQAFFSLDQHTAPVISIAYSPDGRCIVTGSEDETARVWEAASGKLLRTLHGHQGLVASVAVSPDNQWILTSGPGDGTVRLWESVSGKERRAIRGPRCACFSPDGQQILTGGIDETVRVLEAASGVELYSFKGHRDWIESLTFSPDGRRILTGSLDHTAKLWEATGTEESLALRGHRDTVFAVAFSPDSQRVATAGRDGTARIWDATTGREHLQLIGHESVHSVAFSHDGRRLVTGGRDTTVKIWDATTGQELLTLSGHTGATGPAAFSPDGQRVVTASRDKTTRIWDAATGKLLGTLQDQAPVRGMGISPNGQKIVTGCEDGTLTIWDAASGKALISRKGHNDWVSSVAFSPDSQRIVTAGTGDRTAKVWDARTGAVLLTLKGLNFYIWSVAFSPDGRRIFTCGPPRVWDSVTGKTLLLLKGGHNRRILAIACSPDGRRIATGSEDETARIWEAASPQQVAVWQAEEDTAGLRQP